jgi:hypothetical protein
VSDLKADPARLDYPETGIFIRAKQDGRWGAVDLSHLDRESVIAWLNRDEGVAQNVVLILLGHKQQTIGGDDE